ncbi:MAG: type III-B CRISPR module RAMP protein Cmr6 [Bacteroidales bacterium]|jgi:CRISPR-associated protein Cmr6|nr:type III-B CRISPR module RAMP protein Cmr6 [Bacteroidales bacterium]
MGKQQTFKDFDSLGKKFGLESSGERKNAVIKKNEEHPNLGWLFYKNYYAGLENIEDKNKNKVDFLNNKKADEVALFFSEKNQEIINNSSSFCHDKNQINNLISFELKTTYPGLITGVGLNHATGLIGEIKLGFQFDYTTGLPYIPGSSIKGLLRSAFPFSLKVKKEKEQEKNVQDYRNNRFSYIKKLLNNLKDENNADISIDISESEIKTLEYAIFTGTDENGKVLDSPQRDLFLDVMIIKASKNGLIGTDFITPHKHPLKDPNPIQFFKVLPEVVFQFLFKLNETILFEDKAYTKNGFENLKKKLSEEENFDILIFEKAKVISAEKKLALFRQILLDLGIGAKTNVGYGQFSG